MVLTCGIKSARRNERDAFLGWQVRARLRGVRQGVRLPRRQEGPPRKPALCRQPAVSTAHLPRCQVPAARVRFGPWACFEHRRARPRPQAVDPQQIQQLLSTPGSGAARSPPSLVRRFPICWQSLGLRFVERSRWALTSIWAHNVRAAHAVTRFLHGVLFVQAGATAAARGAARFLLPVKVSHFTHKTM